jgi:PAS domain S-box-containing protein
MSELSEAERRFQALVEHIPMVAAYMDEVIPDDPGHSIPIYISPQIEDLLGYPRDAWLTDGELWLQVLHPDDAQRMHKEDEAARRDLTPLYAEYRMVARDGRIVWVSEKAAVFEDEISGKKYWQGVMVDITARKEAEQEKERAAEALREALDIERRAADHLRALDEMKNAFLNAVSHELRTPLASVLGSVLTLERLGFDLQAEDQRQLLRAAAANARKLDRLLSDLLDVDRLSRGVAILTRTPVDLAELARDVAEMVEPRDHIITADVGPTRVEVDVPKVERILENLLTNAIRHTPPGTNVWVKLVADDRGVEVAVEDDGPGVPIDLRETIFQPFQQGNPSIDSPGVGIGLSLVARFADLHGGRAWVEEREGGGASFRVLLPPPEPATVASVNISDRV